MGNQISKGCPTQEALMLKQKDPTLFGGEFVNIVVGNRGYTFRGRLISFASSYFDGIIHDSVANYTNKPLVLKNTKNEVFEVFLFWLYTGQLFEDMGATKAQHPDFRKLLCEVWVFADKCGIPALKNTIIDILIDLWLAGSDDLVCYVQYIYENTSAGADLRKLAVDMVALWWYSLADWVESAIEEKTIEGRQEFLQDLIIRRRAHEGPHEYARCEICRQSNKRSACSVRKCEYHDHDSPGRLRSGLEP
ncbi:hypothetical protein NA57DRAFT_54439 [Rhizodiscina lignyota]|uniref:BTB domain-containing protein n=1 Tax=Rhizodiscina lignyota TaxID=1504668 RepID=A0A9P4MAG4_9PEZI|nr:hypothetical protein NA57DRAFT_54439 [Rhizodiscina lignyota]